jgi:predicted transcriptional regulator
MSNNKEKPHIIVLAEDELEFLILVTLMELGSLSIKNLIRILNSSKATIYRKMSSLVEKELIEIDPKKTAKKSGKYYQITQKTFDTYKNDIQSDNPEGNKFRKAMQSNPIETIERLVNGMRSLSAFHLSLINMLKEISVVSIDQFSEDVLKGYFATSLMELEIKTETEKEEIKKILREFEDKLEKYASKNVGLTDNSYPLYLSMFPLSKKHLFELLDKE